MCGIAGIVASPRIDLIDVATRMRDTLTHRGPDDAGLWVDKEKGLALTHRRLSILDLSSGGHQPMSSGSGRFVIVFNGEIYNFSRIRKELEESGSKFRGHSDTEVMLAAFDAWGVEASLPRFEGMFSFAVWDTTEQALYLSRDRLGEKPLYYGWTNGGSGSACSFVFSSETKAFSAVPVFQKEVNRESLTLFMRHGYIPAPFSIYEGIYKLSQGSFLRLRLAELREKPADFSPNASEEPLVCAPKLYWSSRRMVERALTSPFAGSFSDAVTCFDDLLRDVIKDEMVSDVPLGAFLSGGVDSSAIVAIMQAQSSIPVRSFSIGFFEDEYNEAHFAKEVAKHLGTMHTELYCSPKDALDVIPLLPSLYDEPFADSSQVPTYLVSKLARENVTVSLSGDGGDELFGGYPRYIWARNIWRVLDKLPGVSRNVVAALLKAIPQSSWDFIHSGMRPVLPSSFSFHDAGHKAHKLASVIESSSGAELYFKLLSYWNNPAEVVLGAREPQTLLSDKAYWLRKGGFFDHMMYVDMMSYLADDIMVKVDRASMGVSLESRAPLLHHRIAEFAWSLPLEYKVDGGVTKKILREVLYRYVPKTLIERPKRGFGIPIDVWLRGELRDWASELLSEKRLREQGFFNPAMVQAKWQEHLSGKRSWAGDLWIVLMFQAWYENKPRS